MMIPIPANCSICKLPFDTNEVKDHRPIAFLEGGFALCSRCKWAVDQESTATRKIPRI